jgi:hypothetical protein
MAEDLRDMTLKLHFEAQVKFCYYLISLTTALLGLSIQFTAPTNTELYPSLVFLSWLALVISLISGLSWQQQWINWTREMHSGLVNLSKENKEVEDSAKSCIEDNKTIDNLILAERIQVGFLITGLVLFATYKMVNFYCQN